MSRRLILIVAVSVMFLSSAGIVTFLSAQEWSPASLQPPGPQTPARAAPAEKATPLSLETQFSPDRITRTSSGNLWRVSLDLGVLFSADGGKTWEARNTGLPQRTVYPFTSEKPPIITGLSVDALNEDRVAISTLDAIFVSADGGQTWQKVELKDPIRANDQLTCLALAPGNPGGMLVGTSFHGFFETEDGGKTWKSLSEALVPLQLGGGSFEEIASIAYDPTDPTLIWFDLGFGKGLYTLKRGTRNVTTVDLSSGPVGSPIRSIVFLRSPGQGQDAAWRLECRTDNARWDYAPASAAWTLVEKIDPTVNISPDKAQRLAVAADKYGIYVSSHQATPSFLPGHINFLKSQGMNSLVLDFKDDFGYLTYDTNLAIPREIGAVQKRFKIDDVVQEAHAAGMYLIGRIVVFRDKQLYNADNYAYAAWDRTANGPWRYLKKTVDEQTGEESFYQGEYWVDPYSEYVWDYNIAIARELQDHGVDEVQFDYIRFPSDGDLGRITWRFRRPGMGKMEALESFLAKARENLTIPISTDVYGYCGWARISNWVGQNIEMYSRYVDVIQPMFYPSHFPRDFLGSMSYLPRAEYIYQEGTRRSAYIVEGRSIIRPYVQAFRIGGELNFSPQVYSTYLVDQVQGALQGAAQGFTLWNASNDYYMVTVPLGPMISQSISSREVP
ncbi:MAG TPA: putative glycoside hydrolase [Spirochaetia bacterium]|nr:putative glycoside hydrolase [Spirochaetia bacterium]